MAKATYRAAGVDLDADRVAISRVQSLLRRTSTPRVIPLDGGFAGLFELDFDSPLFARGYRRPVLVASSDGVGTKLKVAVRSGRHRSVGIDLVAMCVNDAICCGAEPLFFLDYIVLSHEDAELIEEILSGISDGCLQADCARLGGETAVHPGDFAPGEYDLAGFCVGVVERDRVIDGSGIAAGDVVIGVASSGIHSNGFSLVRKVVFEMAGLSVDDMVDELGQTVGDALLEPTHIYVKSTRRILGHYKVKQVVRGVAHVTGGGLRENLVRILPEGTQAVLLPGSWPVPPVFRWVQRLGDVDDEEMERVFNMGVGLVLVVRPFFAESIRSQLAEHDLESWPIGEIIAGPKSVVWQS